MSGRYDPPPPATESAVDDVRREVAGMRAQLNAVADALIYLCERAEPMAERWPILQGLKETKT